MALFPFSLLHFCPNPWDVRDAQNGRWVSRPRCEISDLVRVPEAWRELPDHGHRIAQGVGCVGAGMHVVFRFGSHVLQWKDGAFVPTAVRRRMPDGGRTRSRL